MMTDRPVSTRQVYLSATDISVSNRQTCQHQKGRRGVCCELHEHPQSREEHEYNALPMRSNALRAAHLMVSSGNFTIKVGVASSQGENPGVHASASVDSFVLSHHASCCIHTNIVRLIRRLPIKCSPWKVCVCVLACPAAASDVRC